LEEIPDSEETDEDYGWQDEDDAAMPGMPPQWQGSEDLLLGHVENAVEDGGDDVNRDETNSRPRDNGEDSQQEELTQDEPDPEGEDDSDTGSQIA
jgi:hypothetical protein